MIKVEMLINTKPILGEGPVWDEREKILYWIDGLGCKIYKYQVKSGKSTEFKLDQYVGSIALRENGGAVAALQHGFHFFDPGQGEITLICDPEADLPNNRLNDGKCDCAGRFWAGSMNMDANEDGADAGATGRLYRLDKDGTATAQYGMVTISNGLGWNPDNTRLYYIDSPTRVVWQFDFDSGTGCIANQQTAVDFGSLPGIPDGMCVDEEGMLWVCHYDGYMVSRWNPLRHKMIDKIDLPAKKVTCCTFGGDNLDELYITTSGIGAQGREIETAGGLYVCKPGVKGPLANRFGG